MEAAKVQSYGILAREAFTALVLAALLLVTGCGSSSEYMPRAALAPPPPFMTGVQSYGPSVSAEVAMARIADSIAPAAGEGFPAAELPADAPARKCFAGTGYTSDGGSVGFGFGSAAPYDVEHRFSGLHSGGQMTVHLTFALPSPRKSVSCR